MFTQKASRFSYTIVLVFLVCNFYLKSEQGNPLFYEASQKDLIFQVVEGAIIQIIMRNGKRNRLIGKVICEDPTVQKEESNIENSYSGRLSPRVAPLGLSGSSCDPGFWRCPSQRRKRIHGY